MENKIIPTAEEFKHEFSKSIPLGEKLMHFRASKEISDCMIEFAKLHVQAALESALEDAPYGSSTDTVSYKDMKDAILNAYPLDKIK